MKGKIIIWIGFLSFVFLFATYLSASAQEEVLSETHREALKRYNQGVEYVKSKNYDKAIAEFQECLKLDPQNAQAHYALGLAYTKKYNLKKAILEYNQAVEISPNFADANYNLGLVLRETKNYEKAISAFKDALRIDPTNYKAYFSLGLTYYDLKKNKAAIGAYQKALEIKPDYYRAYYNLGVVYSKEEEFPQAIVQYQKATEIKPSHFNAYYRMADAYNQLGEYDKAVTAAQKALKYRSNYAPALVALGEAYEKLGKSQEAIDVFQEAAKNSKWKEYAEYRMRMLSGSGNVIVERSTHSPDIVEKPTYPPILRGAIYFSEPSGNDILDAGESASLKLHLTNDGKGNAYNLTFNIKPAGSYPHISLTKPIPISTLSAAKTTTVEIPISANIDLPNGEAAYTINVSEVNGFNLDPPLKIRFKTQALRPPRLIVADYGIEDFNHNRKIERSEIVKVTARIQNTGIGKAKLAKASVSVGENVFLTPDSKGNFDLGEVAPGEYKDISFSLFTNNIATSLPVTVTLSEAYNRYGSTKRLDLPFDVVQKQVSELVVKGRYEKSPVIKSAPQLVADVDRNIPQGHKANPYAVAVVIGISDYQNPNVVRAKFARRDASVMREYLIKALGYDPENILPRNPDELITAGTFKTLIRRKLPAYIRQGESDAFIYYSGHGAPSTETQEAFFVPYDCDPNYANRDNAYNVREFYEDVAKLKAKSIALVIDACYTGQVGNGKMLVNSISPVLVKVENPLLVKPNVTVFTASTEEQVANWYPEKKHGMFTYFFLKGIKGAADFNGDKQVTVGEMQRYLTDPSNGVPYWSNRKFQRPQTPVVTGDKNRVLVGY